MCPPSGLLHSLVLKSTAIYGRCTSSLCRKGRWYPTISIRASEKVIFWMTLIFKISLSSSLILQYLDSAQCLSLQLQQFRLLVQESSAWKAHELHILCILVFLSKLLTNVHHFGNCGTFWDVLFDFASMYPIFISGECFRMIKVSICLCR